MNPVKTWLSSDCFLCNDLDCRLSSIDKFINFFKNYILTFSSNCSLFSSLENNKMKVIKNLPVFLCKGLVDPGFSSFTILQDNSFKIDSYQRDLIFHFCKDSTCNWQCNIRGNSGIFYQAILNKINWNLTWYMNILQTNLGKISSFMPSAVYMDLLSFWNKEIWRRKHILRPTMLW